MTIALPGGGEHSFRYLAADDYWFDEESADGHYGVNSLLRT